MQNSQLNRVINLIKRTGDKTVIMDNESDAALMLMDLDAYEKMLGNSGGVEKLTEEELMERINRDVAVWRAYNDKEIAETYDKVVEKAPVMATQSQKQAEPVRVVPSREIPENAPITINKYDNINGAAMAGQVEQEHSASDIVAEEEEEKFYLEPVE